MERIVVQRHFPKAQIQQLKRVAAYARVSSGKDAMLHSLSAQVSYYSELIQNHSGWQYAGVYADEALTGTKDTRDNFQRLLTDCRAGKIDMVITKSISRFARNTVTLLETVRELKSLGVDVYFEEQNLHSISPDGEMMLTILASYAQEESLSASENQKWRIRKNFEAGIPWRGYMYGYRLSDEQYQIVPEEAEVIRRIFAEHRDGSGYTAIANRLNEDHIPSPKGLTWSPPVVRKILSNYAYTGNLLLQKTFTVDFLQKKKKINEGEVPQYYVEHSHKAIINPEEWERVQLELTRRKGSPKRTYCNSPFASKLVCGDCGGHYGSKVWHSNSKYRRIIWRCNAKYSGSNHCNTPHLYEDDLKRHFIAALSELLRDRETLLEDGRFVRRELLDFAAMDSECDELAQEMDMISDMIKKLVNGNATQAVSQTAYTERYNKLVEKYETMQNRYDALRQQKERRQIQADAISGCLFALSELDLLQMTFSESLWNATVDCVTIHADERLVFRFKNGAEVTVQM